MPDDPAHALVSMGNYLFSRQALVGALLADARRSTDHDFGRSIIPELVPSGRVFAYDFGDTAELGPIVPMYTPSWTASNRRAKAEALLSTSAILQEESLARSQRR